MILTTFSEYDSSTVKSASYDFKTKTLLVIFEVNSYAYNNVSEEDWNSFNTAKSQGKALNEFIKPKYTFEKIEDIF